MKWLIITFLIFLTSCASYVEGLHKQIDQEESQQKHGKNRNQNRFDLYRKGQLSKTNSPNNRISSKNTKEVLPAIKRNYESQPEGKPRVTTNDFIDNDNNGSLWNGSGQDSFLFSKNSLRKSGDIILVKVQKKLKNEISLELSKAFPDTIPRKTDAASGASKDAAKNSEPKKDETGTIPSKSENTAGAEQVDEKSGAIYDQISSVVVEEIKRDYLMLRGRKEVLYKNKKRFIELQAMVSRKDIDDEDSILSDNILETQIIVMD